jgi:NAD(P)-dependent dehydrogenase (short-subunit alcohol dehydrogenase family)
MGDLDGMTVLVTGAARGMGRAHAVRIAEAGADVALLDRRVAADDLERTAGLVAGAGRRAVCCHADVRDAEAMVVAVDQARAKLGALDGCVANAGIAPAGHRVWEIPPDDWAQVLEVNLTGTFNTCRAVIPHLIERGDGGALVLISSTAGTAPLPSLAHYNASKAGVRALSATLANELGEFGIRCNTVLPGSIDTPMTDEIAARAGLARDEVLRTFVPLQLLDGVVQAGDVSEAVAWLLSPRARFVTGEEIRVDAGLLARTMPSDDRDPFAGGDA